MSTPGLRRGFVSTACLVAVAMLVGGCGGSSHHHRATTAKAPPPTPPPKPAPAPTPPDSPWLFYGYNVARTRQFPGGQNLNPPFRRGWLFRDFALLEFPPVIYDNTMYFLDYYGHAKAVSTLTGRPIWKRSFGTLAAASPGIDPQHGLVFFVLLSTTPGARLPGNGRVVAVSMQSGKIVWAHGLGAGSESSPLILGQSVIIGDAGGTIHSYNVTSGRQNWTFQASGAVKGGLAFGAGKVFLGDYGGHVYALDPRTGHEIWSRSVGGTFYSTPAAAFGRVYLGNTNGEVYAFSQGSGSLSWSASTGSYVYASPAAANVPGLGPTIYEGSYDASFRAYNAYTGAVRWVHPAGGRINGSAEIVGNVVYYSDLGLDETVGLDLRSGRPVYSFNDGEFASVIADGRAVFLIGYSTIYQLLPKE